MPVTLKASVAVEDGRRAITTRHCASPTCVAGRRAVTDRVDRLESAVASDPETVETDWFDRELSTIESLVERHGVKASADGVWAGGEAPIAEPSELSSEAAESWLGGAETYRSVFDRLATLDETIDDLRASLLDVADVADRVVDVRRQAAEVNAALTDTREAVAAAHPAVAERVATDDAAVADEVAAADEDGAQTTEEAETADAQGFCDDCGTVMDRSVHPTFGSTTDAKQEKGFTLQAGEWTTFEVDSHCASATCASAHDDLESRFSKMEAALDRAESEPSLRDRVGRVVAEASEELDPASLVDDPGQLIDSSMSGGRELAVQFRGIVSRDPTVEFHRQANAARQQLDRMREDAEACRVTLDGELADAADTLDEIRTRAAETDGLRVGERGKALTDRIGEFVEEHEPADGLNAGEKLAELRSGMAGLDESVEAETREEAVEAEGEADEATVETETETVEAGETRGGRGDDPNGDGRVIENLGGDPDEPSRSGQSDERGPLADRLDDRLESDDDPGIEDDPRPDDGTGTDDRSERTEPTGSREDEQSPDAEEATDTDREPATTEQSDEADRSTTRDSADPRVGARAGELDREPAESGDAVSPEEATTGAHGDELNEDVVESADPVTLEEATGGTQGEEPEDVVVESTSGVTPDEATAGTHGGEPTEEPIESTDAVTPEEATTGTHGKEPTTETVESADPVTPEEATAGTDEADVATGDIAVTPSEVDADTDEPAEPDEETRDRVTPEGATAGTRPDDRAATPVRPAEARAGAGSIDPDDVDETDTESERTLVDEVEAELEEEEEDEEELGLGL